MNASVLPAAGQHTRGESDALPVHRRYSNYSTPMAQKEMELSDMKPCNSTTVYGMVVGQLSLVERDLMSITLKEV